MEELNTGAQIEQEAAALEEPQFAPEEQPVEVSASEILGLTEEETTDEPEEQPQEGAPPEDKVEIAFGKRLAHEKTKIERKYAPIVESVKELFGIEGDDLSAIEKALVEKRVKDAAEKYGIDEGLARDIYGKPAPEPEAQPLPRETIDRLNAEEATVKADFPDFSLVEALESHPRYAALVFEGDITVAQFNALVNPKAAEKQQLATEAKITDNMQKRQEKPKPQDPRHKGLPKLDVDSLTREQMDEIAERVLYGERVLLE